ncbi:MAG: hypothetical protein HRU80_00400 [Ignavibacteriales bacterium]|nr:MAG: hypothetical protein HRU80_00400 [Ignavibacteriales bacterium]
MKNSISLLILAFLFLTGASYSQEWETFEATEYNVKISLPPNWKTSTGSQDGIPYLEGISADETMSLFIFVYKDASISTQELLNNAVNDLGIALEGESAQENLNGMDAWVASATGVIEGAEIDMFIAAATYDENNYVAYVFTAAANAQKNVATMNKIIDSLAPLK